MLSYTLVSFSQIRKYLIFWYQDFEAIVQTTVSISKKELLTSDLDNSIEAFFSLKLLFFLVLLLHYSRIIIFFIIFLFS